MTNPPGWYPDPLGGQGARYWDGTQWDGAIQPETQDFPESPPPEAKSRSMWPVWVGLAVTGAVAIGSAAFVMTRTTSDTPQATPATSPPTSTEASPTPAPAAAVASEVQRAMQRNLDDDPDLVDDLTVVEVLLVHKSGNEYKGIATVKTADDTEHDVPVDVTADDENVLWETPPGAFAFAEESRPLPPRPPAPRLPPPPPPALGPDNVEDFKLCPSGLSGVASAETSCAFADSVRRAWYSQPGAVVTAYSPVTGRLYTMRCTPADTTAWTASRRCTGTNPQGDPLIVYIS